MNKETWLLTQLSSECSEVAHRITKAIQFGIHEIQPGQELDNEARVFEELYDLFGVLELLVKENIIKDKDDESRCFAMDNKIAKVRKMMEYAREQGVLE